jgi:ferredoxin
MKDEDGVMRWKINHEACFNYWNITGTDCGKCIQVCPFSHPNNLMHNIVRKGIKPIHSVKTYYNVIDCIYFTIFNNALNDILL